MSDEIWSPDGIEFLKVAFGYTDEQIDQIKENPKLKVIVEHYIDIAGKRMIAECIAVENCYLHEVGDKYVFGGPGNMLKEESCEQPCLFAMHNFLPFCYMLYDRVSSGLDPNDMILDHVQCSDTGVKYGGAGKATFRIYVEDAP